MGIHLWVWGGTAAVFGAFRSAVRVFGGSTASDGSIDSLDPGKGLRCCGKVAGIILQLVVHHDVLNVRFHLSTQRIRTHTSCMSCERGRRCARA